MNTKEFKLSDSANKDLIMLKQMAESIKDKKPNFPKKDKEKLIKEVVEAVSRE